MGKRLEYHIITGDKGFKDLEAKVTERMNMGWKTIGGIAFNGGYPYQAMACIGEGKEPTPEPEDDRNKALGMTTAAGAYKRLEDLT